MGEDLSPPIPEQEFPTPTGQADFAQQYRLEHGDIYVPGQPNGVEVIRLPERDPQAHVPGVEVFPLSYEHKGVSTETIRNLTLADYCGRIRSGEVEVEALESINHSLPGQTIFPRLRFIKKEDYLQAVADGRIRRDTFDDDDDIVKHNSSNAVLAELVAEDASLEESILARPSEFRPYIDDLDGIEVANGAGKGIDGLGVREVFELRDGRDGLKTIRMINFSDTPFSDEQLAQAANVVRVAADRDGGAVFDKLHTIAILPKDHSSMIRAKKNDDGTITHVPIYAYQGDHLLAINEIKLMPDDQRPEVPAESKAYLETFLLPGEPTEGPGRPKGNVAGPRFEVTLAHEITHMQLPHYIQQKAPIPGPSPTLLGRVDKLEHVAEVGASLYAGGEDAQRVLEEQREGYEAMWKQHRAPVEGQPYGYPVGPHYVTCREIDITQGRLPFRVLNPDKPAGAYVVYKLQKTPVTPPPLVSVS